MGIFTCHCPGEIIVDLCHIFKDRGAQTIHFCTCTFAKKDREKWILGDGFCDHVDELIERIHREVGLRCVKGTAHLPSGYTPKLRG